MDVVRQQLTLFLKDKQEIIEQIRATYNPRQHNLIAAHFTLGREDEIENIESILDNVRAIRFKNPIKIELEHVERFSDSKGVWIPIKFPNPDFDSLRIAILGKASHSPLAHIPLMHPRNSICTDDIFKEIDTYILPKTLCFDEITPIEQKNVGKCQTICAIVIIY